MKKNYSYLKAILVALCVFLFSAFTFAEADPFTTAKPALLSAGMKSENAIQVSWKGVEGADYYKVYYKEAGATAWKGVKNGVKGTSFTHVSSESYPIQPNVTYVYTVRAVKGELLSAYDKTGIAAQLTETPVVFTSAIPDLLTAKAKAYNSVQITWSTVPNADYYRVYYKEAGASAWKGLKNGVTGTSFTHTASATYPLMTGTTYLYTVRAVKDGTLSGYDKGGIPVKTTLGTVALTDVKSVNFDRLQINWAKLPGAEGYYVYRKENGKWANLGRVQNATSFVHVGSTAHPIELGVDYTYTVKAYIKTANGTVYSSYSTVGVTGRSAYADGWVEMDGDTYYYKAERPITGWQLISGKYYYFDAKGKLLKNQIVGSYYVDEDGVRSDNPEIKKAVALVNKVTNINDTPAVRYEACFDYFVNKCVYERAYDKESITKMPEYASYMFDNKKGNCYRGASALAYCAKVLGFEVRVVVGGVTMRTTGDLSVHGWTEIKIDDNWYMADISMNRYGSPRLFMLLRSQYPYRLRADNAYYLSANNGAATWHL